MRHLDAHEHGVGALNIAIDGTTVAMEFQAPGADIVGFEHPAESEADLAAIAAATATLSAPLDLFVVPKAAACVVTQARAEIEGDEDHDEDHHEGHDEDDHAGAEHKDHDEDHADATGHTEFHAEYTLTCTQPDALTKITFAYFDVFPNAKGVDVQMITTSGAQAFDVGHDAPVLDLGR
ncbi:MAG: ZrgA family zinc uptake protein [Paracoccaceae bacterium]